MQNSSRSTPAFSATVEPTRLHATDHGTSAYRRRFADRFASDYFRATSFGPTVSSIGLGTYLGANSDEDDTAYVSAIRAALDSGINLLDTAINYRGQRSERAVGTAVHHLLAAGTVARSELVICSKGGYIPLDRTPPATRAEYAAYVKREFIDSEILVAEEIVAGGHSLAPRFLRYCLAKSRQNLGLRTIDVYYLHNPGQQLAGMTSTELRPRIRGAFAMLEEAVGRGEIGVYGVATWHELRVAPDATGHLSLEDLVSIAREIAGDAHHFRAVQLPVNLAMLDAVRVPTQSLGSQLTTVAEAAVQLGLTVFGSATLMQASLTTGLSAAIHGQFPRCTSDAQRAIAFARALPGITASLVGMKNQAHVAENLGAAPASI